MIELTGTFSNLSIDYKSRKPIISFLIKEDPGDVSSLLETPLRIQISRESKRRSLDSNAYFHVLCDKLRQKRRISMAECKNDLITTYGQIWYIDDGMPFTYKTNAEPEYIKQREEIHLKYICPGEDGTYFYRAYRGSHTYDTAEMAQLIEGTIMEAKSEGIETATPEQIAHMQMLWERKHDKANRCS